MAGGQRIRSIRLRSCYNPTSHFEALTPRETYILTAAPSSDGTIIVEGDELRHLSKVLRARRGDCFMAFDGSGRGWEACILQVSSSRVVASVKRTLSDPLLTPAVTLAVGSIKASRMDWAVEKAAELGAVRFIPLESRFSVVEPGVGKLRRWRSLALAAAKQSHRLRLMEIADPNTVAVALNDLPRPLLWCSIAEESEPIIECLRKLGSFSEASILIGPEGGWAEEEIAALRASQALPISLGTHPLRTESAVAVALGITLNAALQR